MAANNVKTSTLNFCATSCYSQNRQKYPVIPTPTKFATAVQNCPKVHLQTHLEAVRDRLKHITLFNRDICTLRASVRLKLLILGIELALQSNLARIREQSICFWELQKTMGMGAQ